MHDSGLKKYRTYLFCSTLFEPFIFPKTFANHLKCDAKHISLYLKLLIHFSLKIPPAFPTEWKNWSLKSLSRGFPPRGKRYRSGEVKEAEARGVLIPNSISQNTREKNNFHHAKRIFIVSCFCKARAHYHWMFFFFAPSEGKWVLKMKRGGFVPYGSIFTWGGGAGGNFSARTKSKPSLINTLCPEKLYNCTETIRFREVLLLLPGTIYNIHTAAGCFNKVKN